MSDLFGFSTATFSPCRTWRYVLTRIWDASKPLAMFIALNPSTADELTNDRTVKRCIGFAFSWGFGGLYMTNLFGVRTKDPKIMIAAPDPVGPDNDYWLRKIANDAGIIIAAWGNDGSFMERNVAVKEMFRGKLNHLGLTQHGHPRHPLYLKRTETPQFWEEAA